jgi:hypothetical protein
MKVITHQEYFFHTRREGIDERAGRFQALGGLEDRFRILGVALRPFVITVDDVRVGDDGEIELGTVRNCFRLKRGMEFIGNLPSRSSISTRNGGVVTGSTIGSAVALD